MLVKNAEFRVRQIVQIPIQLLTSCGNQNRSTQLDWPWVFSNTGRILHKVLREII